ncbi:SAF domain-containing protein [Microbispora bryophytorum]|uniref:SAF domain-containing protein n=1 Tax=Microbispora bryophytorum TaxID=1460882 RepID=UPI0033C42834
MFRTPDRPSDVASRQPQTLRPRITRGPFSGIVTVLVVTGLVVAGLWSLTANRQVPVLVATADLPAYQEVEMKQLTLDTRVASDAGDYATVPVEGRITLKAIKKGEPLLDSDLSPSVRGLIRGQLMVIGLDVSRGDVLGGGLRSGDPIRVLLVRRDREPIEIRAVVLSASPASSVGTAWSLVVAMSGQDARRHAGTLASGDLLILKDPKAAIVTP